MKYNIFLLFFTIIIATGSRDTFATVVQGDAAIVLNNKIYFTGNQEVQVYDIAQNSWSAIELSENKFFVPAIAFNNKIAFIGGMTEWFVYSKIIEIYDPATHSWTNESMSADMYYESVISYNNYIYSAGGMINQENTLLSGICKMQL